MSRHHRMGPSSASRWLACTASPQAIADAGIEDKAGLAAAEGTVAHLVTEWVRNGEIGHASEALGQVVEQDGFEITIDEEMVEHTTAFVEYVRQFQGTPYVEVEVALDPWHPTGFGTADHAVIDEDRKIIVVIDFKYGKGVKVSADANPQLRLYALGVVGTLGWLHGLDDDVDTSDWTVVTGVHQPRIGNIDAYQESLPDLLHWGTEYVQPRSVAAQAGEGEFVPGEHCRFCPLSGRCAAQTAQLRNETLADFDRLPAEKVYELSDEALGSLLDELPQLQNWLKSIEMQAKARVEAGRPVIGKDGPYKLVAGRGSRDYTDPAEAEAWLVKQIGEDKAFERKLLSPAKAEKLLPKELRVSFGELTTKRAGAPTLAPATDARDPLPSADGDFAKLED